MNRRIFNNQDSLAEQFILEEINVTQASYEALLKIKRCKFIMKIPGIGVRLREEAAASIKKTFLSYTSNTYVLMEEGYYVSSLDN
jgi:hypothetical protein